MCRRSALGADLSRDGMQMDDRFFDVMRVCADKVILRRIWER
jgi:hypothetical protein